MNPDAFAGFLRLWLTPADRIPSTTPDVDAYIRYLNQAEPLSDDCRALLGHSTEQAA